MVRQYIGARYVPLFYTNSLGTSEWVSGVLYDPLTIVTYNGNSYTSKKEVPANIGDPSHNPTYWVATGNFNSQLNDVQNALVAAQGDIDDINKKVSWYTPEMYGAVGDGETDDTDAIQAMFDDVPDESVIVFSKSKYIITDGLIVRGNNLVISGAFGRAEYAPQICGNFTSVPFIENRGSGNLYQNLLLLNTGTKTGSVGIKFDADNATYNGNVDCVVDALNFYNFDTCIETLGRNLKVFNTLFSTSNTGIKLKQTDISTELRGYDFHNNRIHSTGLFVNNGITNSTTHKNIFVHDNFLDYCSTIFYGYGCGTVIQDNLLDSKGVGGTGITLKGDTLNSHDYINVITGNTIYGGSTTTNGISLENDVKAIVKDNIITHCNYNGISVGGSSYAVIDGNVISNCGINSGAYPIVGSGTATGYIINNVIIETEKGIGGATVMTKENNYVPA